MAVDKYVLGGVRLLVVTKAENPPSPLAVRLGGGLAAARRVAGLTQEELADRLTAAGIRTPKNYVGRWEIGTRLLDLSKIEKAEEVMGLTRGTVFRLAGFVDDGELIDLGSLAPGVRQAVEDIVRALGGANRNGTDGT
jgi:transcriptional regulator with XRE-family HTH domain